MQKHSGSLRRITDTEPLAHLIRAVKNPGVVNIVDNFMLKNHIINDGAVQAGDGFVNIFLCCGNDAAVH